MHRKPLRSNSPQGFLPVAPSSTSSTRAILPSSYHPNSHNNGRNDNNNRDDHSPSTSSPSKLHGPRHHHYQQHQQTSYPSHRYRSVVRKSSSSSLAHKKKLSTLQLRVFFVACLLLYCGTIYFADTIVELAKFVGSDHQTRQKFLVQWRPTQSATIYLRQQGREEEEEKEKQRKQMDEEDKQLIHTGGDGAVDVEMEEASLDDNNAPNEQHLDEDGLEQNDVAVVIEKEEEGMMEQRDGEDEEVKNVALSTAEKDDHENKNHDVQEQLEDQLPAEHEEGWNHHIAGDGEVKNGIVPAVDEVDDDEIHQRVHVHAALSLPQQQEATYLETDENPVAVAETSLSTPLVSDEDVERRKMNRVIGTVAEIPPSPSLSETTAAAAEVPSLSVLATKKSSDQSPPKNSPDANDPPMQVLDDKEDDRAATKRQDTEREDLA